MTNMGLSQPEKVVFTNGCFDILHAGHLDFLARAKSLGDKLIVGINSDKSVRAIKGSYRPLIPESERAEVLRALRFVDEVRIFDENTPQRLIEEICPHVLVKGGDWPVDQIIGAEFVIRNGGKVFSLPLKEGYSTTKLIEKISSTKDPISQETTMNHSSAVNSLREHVEVIEALMAHNSEQIEKCADILAETISGGGKILLCGNGGSAADAQHIAAEFVGRFEKERRGLAAIALTTDTSALTAIANDYGFEKVYVRQIEALAREGDALVALSTSGNSPNVLAAVMAARKLGCKTIALTGANGKKLSSLCDSAILVPSSRTSRIQEGHNLIGHVLCEMVDEKILPKESAGRTA